MILTELATASETLVFSHPLSFSWTSWAWDDKGNAFSGLNERIIPTFSTFFWLYHVSLPAVGKQSCRCQWPKRAHKPAQPCSSPLHCLWKGSVIRPGSVFCNKPHSSLHKLSLNGVLQHVDTHTHIQATMAGLLGVMYLRWPWSVRRQPSRWCRPPSHPASRRCRRWHRDHSPERGLSSGRWANSTHTHTQNISNHKVYTWSTAWIFFHSYSFNTQR